MAGWTHTYREQAIPGPNPSGIITEHRPGQKLAKVVTEIQEKVPNAVRSDLGEGLVDEGTAIEGGDLVLRLALEQDSENFDGEISVVESFKIVAADSLFKQIEKTVVKYDVEQGVLKSVISSEQEVEPLPFVPSPQRDVQTLNVDVAVDVFFDAGSKSLKKKKKQYQFENGFLVDVVDLEDELLIQFEEFACS